MAAALLGLGAEAAATEPGAPAPVRPLALLRLDALGLDPELVGRLEGVLRVELERLAGAPLPDAAEVRRVAQRDPAVARCAGEEGCVAAFGRAVGTARVVLGNVGGLGESYVINLKLVDAATAREVRRISEPLEGDPAALIEAVRVAAYRVATPERMRGSIALLADVRGARVELDGRLVGTTPLVAPVAGVPIGRHRVRLTADGYSEVSQQIEVRFEKTTQLVVRLRGPAAGPAAPPGTLFVDSPPPRWTGHWWFPVAVGGAAAAAGVAVGLLLRNRVVVRDCRERPEDCL